MNLSDPVELAALLEAFLMAAGRPLSLAQLAALFEDAERPEPGQFRAALALLAERSQDRGFELREVASGFRLQVRERFAPWVSRLWEERPQRYSRALLETLALIAYRQPITRGEIEGIRGVAVSSQIIKTLQEREWIRVVGHRDVPGRPAMFATSRSFLDHFNMQSLDELPPLLALRALEGDDAERGVVDEAVPAEAPAMATPAAEDEVPAKTSEGPSFASLVAELDQMEQDLKSDFDDPFRQQPGVDTD